MTASLFGAGAGAANAYTYATTISVTDTSPAAGEAFSVKVNNPPVDDYTVVFNGEVSGTDVNSEASFNAPALAGAYPLYLSVGDTLTKEATITVGTITSLTVSAPSTLTAGKTLKITGMVGAHKAGAVAKVYYSHKAVGGFKQIDTATSNVAGKFYVSYVFKTKGPLYIKAIVAASGTFTADSDVSNKITVK